MKPRFEAMKRTHTDGKVWWCVWDNYTNDWATYTCFGRYKTRSDCREAIKIAYQLQLIK